MKEKKKMCGKIVYFHSPHSWTNFEQLFAVLPFLYFLIVCGCLCVCIQSCWLCSLMDCSLPGSSVHGILHARILEQFAFPSPGDLPYSGIEPTFLVSYALARGLYHLGSLYFLISLRLNFIRRKNIGSLFGS